MNSGKGAGQIQVTTETGYCPFCYRVRNLRREERRLGTLVRTIIACESCHRTLSSTMGVAGADAPAAEDAESQAAAAEPAAVSETQADETAEPKPAPAKRAATPRAKPAAPSAGSKAPKSRPTG